MSVPAQQPKPKKSILKWILLVLLLAIVAFVGVVAMQPTEFRVSRSTQIAAPPEVVFAKLNDLHEWEAWSPWAKIDPKAKAEFSGEPAGKGAVMAWSSENNEVGEGKMTIVESKPNELVRLKLDFVKPFAGSNMAEFVLIPIGDTTTVTWSNYGEHGFMGKAFCLVMNMDKLLGAYFEKGLASLKSVSEAARPEAAKQDAATPDAAKK